MIAALRRSVCCLRTPAALLALVPMSAAAQPPAPKPASCPQAADAAVERGWASYRANELVAAGAAFNLALTRCPGHLGARVGAVYVALRRDDSAGARERFAAIVAEAPKNVDALVGLGLAAMRLGDAPAARSAFSRALEITPSHKEARGYLDRLGPPPFERPPLVLPDHLVYPSRTHGDQLEIRTADGSWKPFYVRGVNIGAATPGHFPSEFPEAATYQRWIRDIAGMGANTVRVYTIHPPGFYDALAAWNRAHPANPLWLIHGVWTELPDDNDFSNEAWQAQFFAEMDRVVDLLHGRADLPPRPGHASGSYTSDLSPWVLAYILGREWEPYSADHYDHLRPDFTSFRGHYLSISSALPMDAVLAQLAEHIIDYETRTYRAQRPVAYVNWPTLDPLNHPTETTRLEDHEIRTRLGEVEPKDLPSFDEDAVNLDATLVHATAEFPAGWFASFHAYPYYPEFLLHDPTYNRASSSMGRSNYFGYLQELKAHHPGMPLLISEYGVPTSIGCSHLQAQGWHQGALTERQMAQIDARLTREIAEAHMAGGIVFAWIDEWFKHNWLAQEFEIPAERTRLWHNRMDPEQNYGMLAEDALPRVAGETLAARLPEWQKVAPLYFTADGSVRAVADESYLWVLLESPAIAATDEIYFGFDTLNPDAGSFRWPGAVGSRLPTGVEFALVVRAGAARLLAVPSSNPFRVEPIANNGPEPVVTPIEHKLPGFFSGRFGQHFNLPYVTRPHDDGKFTPLLVLTNARRFSRDGTELAATGYDRGILARGGPPDGLWELAPELHAVEVRIPWLLLNITDPSQRRLLQDPRENLPSVFGTVGVEGIRIVASKRSGELWTDWPASHKRDDVARFTWPKWEEPKWRERRRPVYDAMREAFAQVREGK